MILPHIEAVIEFLDGYRWAGLEAETQLQDVPTSGGASVANDALHFVQHILWAFVAWRILCVYVKQEARAGWPHRSGSIRKGISRKHSAKILQGDHERHGVVRQRVKAQGKIERLGFLG